MNNKRWIGYLVAGCLLLSSVVVLFYTAKYKNVYKKNVAMVTERSQLQLAYTKRQITEFESKLNSTLVLLDKSRALYNYVTVPNDTNRWYVESIWTSFTDSRHFFHQIAYVDKYGLEKIKVAFSEDGSASSVQNYRNMSDSRYFKQAQERVAEQGSKGNIWQLSLLTDEEGYRIPYTPVVQVAHPYYVQGQMQGYLMIQVDFQQAAEVDFYPDPSYMASIVTSNGDYLSSRYKKKLYGFAIKDRVKFNLSQTEPGLWQQMKSKPQGVYLKNNGDLHIFSNLQVNSVNDVHLLLSFSVLELKEQVEEEFISLVQHAMVIILLIVLSAVPTGYLVFVYKKRSIESKLALAALNGMSAILITDKHHNMVKVNREFENITGYAESQIRYGNLRKLLFDKRDADGWFNIWDCVGKERLWEGELKVHGRAGIELTTITRIQAICDGEGKIANYIISLVDITERKELEERLRYLSERDGLSHLWNRRKFEEELRNETDLIKRYPENHISCLALVDIDYFKRINDEKGHDEGDRVIKHVAHLLSENTRSTDFVARIGGEEFAIIMPHTEINEAEQVLNRIRSRVAIDERVFTTISIGVTDLTEDGTRSYKCADIALYESKTIGRNRTSVCHSGDEIA